MNPQEVRRALWLLVLGFVIAFVAMTLHGCALDPNLPGHDVAPHKQDGRGELHQVDALDPDAAELGEPDAAAASDAGTTPSDARGRFEVMPDASPDTPPNDAGPVSVGLQGAWRVKLVRTYGDGCSGLPATEQAAWTLSGDLGTLETAQGPLRRLQDGYYQGGAPFTDVMLDDGGGMRGERHVTGRAGCVEVWTFEGNR